jgi:hypothetical protein
MQQFCTLSFKKYFSMAIIASCTAFVLVGCFLPSPPSSSSGEEGRKDFSSNRDSKPKNHVKAYKNYSS